MTNLLNFVTFFFLISTNFCATLSAYPDVFFQDSDTYNGAYLRHELEDNGKKIRFILTSPILNTNITHNIYDVEKLKKYIKNNHLFFNQQLRAEFIDMLNTSFISSFTAKEFLEELQKVLDGFSRSSELL